MTEDYSAFSWESIQADLAKMRQELIDKAIIAGISLELAQVLVDIAFARAGRDMMEVNGFVEPTRKAD